MVGLLAGLAWAAVAATASPARVSCDPVIPQDVCAESADAGLRRGMPRFHPLIIEATVAPGPLFPDDYGHRATVRYALLPGPVVEERLFFDAGGHWGAIPDHGDVELAIWALVPVGVTTLLGVAAGGLLARRVVRGPGGP